MDSFEIELKNDKIETYNRISYLVTGINFIFFIIYVFHQKQETERIWWIAFSILIPAFAYVDSIIRNKSLYKKVNIGLVYYWLIIGWFGINIWMSFIHILLLVFDIISRRKLNVCFNKEGIIYPSFPKKNIAWTELQNVVLKDGLLTIDFKDDHILQADIVPTKVNIDEAIFNAYCKQLITL